MELFKIFGRLALKGKEETENSLDEVTNKGEKTSNKLNNAFTKIGNGALAVGKTIAKGLAAGAAAMGGLTVKALNLAGDLEQNMGGSEAVFKEYAESMQKTAKNAFSNMGLSTSDFLATANKMGALFQGAGFSIKESADLTSKAMQRAADVASIMGIDVSSAMEAIAGAAKGNFTMMDNLGVAMNDTTLQAYALSKGISKSTLEMTNQEKISLAMQMFLEKTSYAAGNYAKENETLAGSLGTAKAALTNFLDGSGDVDQLVTAFSGAANVIAKNVNELLPRLVTGLTGVVNGIIPLLPPLIESLLPGVIQGAVKLLNGLVGAMPQIISVLMDALPDIISGVQQIFYAIVDALPELMEYICSALPTLIPQLINAIGNMVSFLAGNLIQIIRPIIDNLPEIITSIVDALMENLPGLINGCIRLIIGIVQALPQIILALIEALPTIIVSIVNGLFKALPILINGIHSMNQQVQNSIWNTLAGIVKMIGNWVGNIWDKIKGIGEKFKNAFKFNIELPKIKLPHFSIKPSGWKIGDLLKGSIPKLGIEWYAKGAVLNKPSIFSYNPATGNAMGGGEAGPEALAPISTLQQYVREAVADANNGISYYLQKILDILAEYIPELANMQLVTDTGVLVGEMAPAMDVELGKLAVAKGRGR